MTAGEIIERARVILHDTAGTVWSDAHLLRYLSDGLIVLTAMRPDALRDENGELITVRDVTAPTDVVELASKWRGPLTDYVCWWAFKQEPQKNLEGDDWKRHQADFFAALRVL